MSTLVSGMREITPSESVLAELGSYEPMLRMTPDQLRRSRTAQRLVIEHGVTGALSRSFDLREATPLIVRAVCEELGWTCGAVWVDEAQDDTMQCIGGWGIDEARVQAFLYATVGLRQAAAQGGLVRRSWLTGAPVWLRDVAGEASFKRAPQATHAGLHSAFAFPIAAAGRVLGVVEFYSQDIAELDAELLDCTRYIGSQIGQFCLRAQAQGALRESEKRYADTIELAAIGISHVDDSGRYVQVNRALCELLGYTREELLGKTVKEISHPEDRDVADELRARLRAGEVDSFQVEKRYLHRNGSTVWAQLSVSVQRDAAGRALHDISITQDITARKLAEFAVQRSEQRFKSLVELSSDWYWELDAELRYTTFGGPGMEEAAQWLLGHLAWELPGAENDVRWAELRARLERREAFRDIEYTYDDQHGQRRHISGSGEPLFDAEGRFSGYRGVSRDITGRKQAEERIQYLATHDSLTGLPNRVMFAELLSHVLAGSRRNQRRFAVLFIDLDRFKFINDSLGHEAGDALLREVARRVKESLRASDIVARLGGDEFVMLLQDLHGAEEAGAIARKLLSAVIKPIELNGQECRVTASIGISLFPDDAPDEASLMTHADLAMYHAKEEGKNNFQFYDGRLETMSLERLTLETQLRRAIERNELSVHYQAKLDLAHNTIAGVEALLRWNSAELGAVSPAKFIPLAEETGLILAIGKWVLRSACAQSVAWQRSGLPPVRVSVNLSPRQLADPDLVAAVRAVLADTGLAPDLLELEVTESSVMHNVERALEVLTALKRMGLRLAIDDFGTGYSSLAQLKRFPIDTLKVDRSFIRELPSDSEDKAIAEAIIAMGKTLSLTVVAEGVETREQQEFLRERACDQVQGFYFSRPVPPSDFAELLRTHGR
ncbi:MAG TPA: EAL domain-containing protein [Burkholderiaceae bacterium]|nr:EAL domain-containing protein [Burkholderiaceae bacterium]